ncbi:MAG: hypothetical protein COA44_08655 [Arcobacter sp.]|nr:MAG: hypothetical protein COA44_08655 [Arcobacter sp.]
MLRKLFSFTPPTKISLDGVDFKIKHSLRRNMRKMIIRVENKYEIRLSSSKVSQKNLILFIQENKSWVLNQHENIKDIYPIESSFYYLNTHYTVKHHNEKMRIQDKMVYINPLKAKLHTDNFYKKQAKAYLPTRVQLWSERMNLSYNKLGFRLAKKRWGSCNSRKNISLNPYMMKLSYEMIDYIIVHELSHLVHLNHSKKFYEIIERYLPGHEGIEKSIKDVSPRLG